MKRWGILILLLGILFFTWMTYAFGPFNLAVAPTLR